MHGTLMLLHQRGIYLDEIWFPAFDICSTHWEDAQDLLVVSSSSHLQYERSIMRRERGGRLIQKDFVDCCILTRLRLFAKLDRCWIIVYAKVGSLRCFFSTVSNLFIANTENRKLICVDWCNYLLQQSGYNMIFQGSLVLKLLELNFTVPSCAGLSLVCAFKMKVWAYTALLIFHCFYIITWSVHKGNAIY